MQTFIKLTSICCLLFSITTYAVTEPTDIQRINSQEQRNTFREINEKTKEDTKLPAFVPKSNQPVKLEEVDSVNNNVKKKCYEVSEIKIAGENARERQYISEIVKNKYTDLCLTKKDIVNILSFINYYYISKGYITTIASIGEQDISSGSLLIKIVDGTIESFDIEDDNNIHEERVFRNLKGKRLNIRDLEQGIEQINSIQSNNASMEILPTKKKGASIVKITNGPAKNPIRLSTSFDNGGSASTGRERIGVTLFIDDPTWNNDSVQLSYRRSLRSSKGKSTSKSINWRIPNNRSTFSLSLNQSNSEYTVNTSPGRAYLAKNNAINTVLSWSHNLYRNQSSRLAHTVKLRHLKPESFIEKVLFEISSRKQSNIDYSIQYDTVIAGGLFNAALGFHKGIDAFSSYSDPDGLSEVAPLAQFYKNSLELGYSKSIASGYNLSTSLVAQRSSDVLYPSQQIYIGYGTTAGFTENSYGGDAGYHWTHKISSRSKAFGATNNVTFSLAHGKVFTKSLDEQVETIVGIGLSLSSSWSAGINTSISTGKAIKSPNNIKEPFFISANLSYDF